MRTYLSILAVLAAAVLCQGCPGEGPLSAGPVTGGDVDGPPVTRSRAVLTADRFARLKWTMTEQNRRGTGCEGGFLSQYGTGPRTGMGYKWGGWTDIGEFVSRIEAGYGTGTGGPVDYSYYPFDCVVGVSCTGLVSRAWDLDHKYTLCYDDPDVERRLCEITTEVEGVDLAAYETAGLQKGDALINATHVVLFVYETRDRRPAIIESVAGGVRFMKTSWHTLHSRGYVPIRYNNIVDDPRPVGTLRAPIEIDPENLPARFEGNTRDVFGMEIDSYPAAPSIPQAGPETVYRIVLQSTKKLRFSIDDLRAEGISNDLFLLSSLEVDESRSAAGCVAYGDTGITAELGPGKWYLVVDSGMDQPGEYMLEVEELR